MDRVRCLGVLPGTWRALGISPLRRSVHFKRKRPAAVHRPTHLQLFEQAITEGFSSGRQTSPLLFSRLNQQYRVMRVCSVDVSAENDPCLHGTSDAELCNV